MSFSEAPEIRFWKASDGVTGMRPPTRPNLRSRDSCTDSVMKIKKLQLTYLLNNLLNNVLMNLQKFNVIF